MQDQPKSTSLNFLASVVTGILAFVIAGFVFYPVAYLVFEKYFELHLFEPDPGFTANDLIIFITLFIWCYFASFSAGFFSTLVATAQEKPIAWTLSGIGWLIYFILIIQDLQHMEKAEEFILTFGLAAMLPAGLFTGRYAGMLYKKRRQGVITQQDNTE